MRSANFQHRMAPPKPRLKVAHRRPRFRAISEIGAKLLFHHFPCGAYFAVAE
jgi:hypothetical protein